LATRSPDVLVIGGGVIGCSVAWGAAVRGFRVTVIERGTPGAAATSAAAGMLSPLGETDIGSPLGSLARASYDSYADFAARILGATGIDVEWRECGKLHVATSEAEENRLDVLLAAGRHDGLERLSSAEARSFEPSLSPDVRAALLITRDARVDNRRLGHAVWHAAASEGVRFRLGRNAQAVALSATGDHRVRLDDGSFVDAGALVIAAGAWSGTITGLPPAPVTPVRGQMFAVSSALIRRTVHAHGCYLIARDDGRTLVGATVEHVGFTRGPTPAGIRRLLDAAIRVVPAIGSLHLLETWAGYRPGTPDDLPVLGEDPDVPRLFWATGHYRNGILLAPITAERIGAQLAGEPATGLDAFTIGRFRSTPSREDDRIGAAGH
jgi:glycine oxidase